MTRTAPLRRTTVCESAIAQVLAENLVCHPSLLRWLTRRTLADLSVDLANDGARVEFVGVHAEGDAGCDLKVVGDFGQIDIGFLISVRFSYRAAEARRAHEAARALSQSGETAYAVSVWVTSQAEIDRMTQEPVHYDRAIALETILDMLEGEARCSAYELQRRRDFQIGLIRRALRRALAATAAPVAPRESFRRAFLDMIADEAPMLVIEEARAREDPDFAMLTFDAEALPRWPFLPSVRLAHHLREGFASILVHDWGEDLDGLAAVMEPALDKTGYTLALAPSHVPRSRPGILILAETPKLDPDRPFALQRREARRCMKIIDEMRAWFVTRKSVVGYWAEFIGHAQDEQKGHKRVRRDLRLG